MPDERAREPNTASAPSPRSFSRLPDTKPTASSTLEPGHASRSAPRTCPSRRRCRATYPKTIANCRAATYTSPGISMAAAEPNFQSRSRVMTMTIAIIPIVDLSMKIHGHPAALRYGALARSSAPSHALPTTRWRCRAPARVPRAEAALNSAIPSGIISAELAALRGAGAIRALMLPDSAPAIDDAMNSAIPVANRGGRASNRSPALRRQQQHRKADDEGVHTSTGAPPSGRRTRRRRCASAAVSTLCRAPP